MRQRLFTVAAAVSAALCVGVCVLWVRSYSTIDECWLPPTPRWPAWVHNRYWFVRSAAGNVELHGLTLTEYMVTNLRSGWWPDGTPEPEACDMVGGGDVRPDLRVPDVIPLLCTAALPVWWLAAARVRRKRRRSRELCLRCGYDLWATPGRCPECGLLTNERTTGRVCVAAAPNAAAG